MHIVLVSAHAGSVLNFRGSFISQLLVTGHRVTIAAPDFTKELESQFIKMGAAVVLTPVSRTGLNPFHDLKYFLALFQLFRKLKPDLILTYAIKPNIWGAFAARTSGVKSVAMVTGLGYAFTGNGGLLQLVVRKIACLLYRCATACNAAVIFLNPDDRDDFINAGCLSDGSKAYLISGEGVDTNHFAVVPLVDEPSYLMISRLLGNKGVREYGKAAIAVKQDIPNVRFALVGDFDEGPDGITKEELNSWIEGGLEFIGPTDDIRPYMAKASVYVLPSYREGVPRSTLEALSMGRAVVTSDSPGCRETVEDGENGYLVPVGDVETLVSRLKILALNPELRAAMGKKGRLKAESRFDVDKINANIMQYLGLK